MGQPRPLFYFVLFKRKFYRKNCSLQRDSNSDCRSARQAHWPLDHHHIAGEYNFIIPFKSLQNFFWIDSSVTRLGRSVNVLGSNISHKKCPNIWWIFLAVLKTTTFKEKLLKSSYFWAIFAKIWTTFYCKIWSHWSVASLSSGKRFRQILARQRQKLS